MICLALASTMIFGACEQKEILEPHQSLTAADAEDINALQEMYGLHQTNTIVIDAKEVVRFEDLTQAQFTYLSTKLNDAGHLAYRNFNKALFVFTDTTVNANLKKVDAFVGSGKAGLGVRQHKAYNAELYLKLCEHANQSGRRTTWQDSQSWNKKPKGAGWHVSYVGDHINDRMTSYTATLKADFPVKSWGTFYEHNNFGNSVRNFNGTDLHGPFYGGEWVVNNVGSKANDKVSSWKVQVSYID